jgi:hypothetical protein
VLSIKFEGDNINSVAEDARKFADKILGVKSSESSYKGYCPQGVGKPEPEYCPIDDGREWNDIAIKDWISRLNENGRKVVSILARKKIIDQREEIESLGWTGSFWAGTWIGPRKQAFNVMDAMGLLSWPYGHSYEEPRRMWMHEDIADLVLKIIDQQK